MSTQIKVVMFTDQIGSTPNGERRTPAKKRQVSEEQSALTAEAAGLCRGVIVADTGDGHMLTFDACADAILCGHLIQQRVSERNAGLSHDPDLQFLLHIGIDFGHAVPLADGNLRSDAANRADRVCSLCPAGDVYFTEKVAGELHKDEVKVEKVGNRRLKGVTGTVAVFRLVQWRGPVPRTPNPFVWRGAITEANAFFDRDREQQNLKDCLHKRQNCQIVGERRIGKTSLLLQIARMAPQWQADTVIAFMDMQHPACFTLTGFLRRAGALFGWSQPPTTLIEFAEGIETMCGRNGRLVLCIDEFEGFTQRRDEFRRDFFLTLRACNGQGLALVTTSCELLSRLTDPGDPTSPFYNNFHVLDLGPFALEDAADFLTLFRPGIAAFTPEEKQRMLDFARCHPLALQIAADHMVEARERGDHLSNALQRANAEMRALLPSW